MKVSPRERNLWLIVLAAVVVIGVCRFEFKSAAAIRDGNNSALSLNEAYRLLQSGPNIIARHRATQSYLQALEERLLGSFDSQETQLALLDSVEDLANASGLQVEQKNLVNLPNGLLGVLLEGTTSAEAFFRMLQLVATDPAGLNIKRLQVHSNQATRGLKYQIIVATRLR